MAYDIVDLAIFFLIGGLLLPIGLNQWFTANTETWDAQTVLTFTIVPVIGLVSIVIGIVQTVRRAGGRR